MKWGWGHDLKVTLSSCHLTPNFRIGLLGGSPTTYSFSVNGTGAKILNELSEVSLVIIHYLLGPELG